MTQALLLAGAAAGIGARDAAELLTGLLAGPEPS